MGHTVWSCWTDGDLGGGMKSTVEMSRQWSSCVQCLCSTQVQCISLHYTACMCSGLFDDRHTVIWLWSANPEQFNCSGLSDHGTLLKIGGWCTQRRGDGSYGLTIPQSNTQKLGFSLWWSCSQHKRGKKIIIFIVHRWDQVLLALGLPGGWKSRW